MSAVPALVGPCTLLFGAALQIVVARFFTARVKGILAVFSCIPSVFAVAWMLPFVRTGQAVEFTVLHWDGPLNLAFHIDALSVLFAFMGASVGALVLLYSVGYMAHDKAATRFYFAMLIFIGGFIGLVYSANLFVFYLCWELIGLCSFSLVGFWYTNREAVKGARKVLLMTHIAGYGFLTAVLVLYYRAGSALWTDPAISRNFSGGIFLLMLVALVAKSVQVPLHTWIPEAMAAPTPVSSLLHAACYVTAGVYLAARMHSFGVWPESWSASLVWIGTITMAVGVMYAMVQTDLKRMLAYSTVSQIGYMMLGLGIGTPLAITAGLLHCLNHGFFKGGLFLNAGAVQHATGTRDMNELGGLAGRMPKTTMWWLIGVGNMAGIPLMSGFVSKWMLYAAALQAGWAVPAIVAWTVSLGTVFICAKATSAVFLGDLTEKTERAQEAPPTMQWAMGIMAVGSIVLGIAPQLAVNYLLNPVLNALSLGVGVQITWFGLFAGAGSFSTVGGLVLAIVSVVLGGTIYAIAYAARPVVGESALAAAGGGIFTGGEPLSGRGRLTAGDFSEIFRQNWQIFFRWSNVDQIYLSMWHALRSFSSACNVVVERLEQRAILLMVLLPVGLLLCVRYLSSTVATIQSTVPSRVPTLITAACAIAASALILAAFAQTAWRRLVPLMILASAAAVTGLAVYDSWLRLALLELAALFTIPLVWRSAKTQSARLVYVVIVVISALSLLASDLLAKRGVSNWAVAFLLTSACVKLAAFPFLFWLLRLADELPALVLGLIVAVIDVASFGELYVVVHASPGLIAPQGLWLGVAVVTSLVASLLMLSQRSIKHLLVLSTIEDVGFLSLGLASITDLGSQGVMFAATTHAVAKALLFACVSSPEANGAVEVEHPALAVRYPVSAFGFLVGMLAMLGVPPTLGYIGRWRLYETALRIHPMLLVCFLLSSVFALIAYVLALTQVWWGPEQDAVSQRRMSVDADQSSLNPRFGEPLLLRAVIVGLVALLLAGGLWPHALQMLPGGRP